MRCQEQVRWLDVAVDQSLFVGVLESSGFTVQREGEIDRIVRLPERKTGMGAIVADGPPAAVLTRANLRAVYGIEAEVDLGGAWPTITALGRSRE